MIFEEMMEEERNAGRTEAKRDAVFELLEDVGAVSESLKERIEELSDEKQLKALLKLAARTESIEEFEREAQAILLTKVTL